MQAWLQSKFRDPARMTNGANAAAVGGDHVQNPRAIDTNTDKSTTSCCNQPCHTGFTPVER